MNWPPRNVPTGPAIQRSKIVTTFVNPPIPVRSFDWSAHFDGQEEASWRGWGATEADAIADLREQCGDHCRTCDRAYPIHCTRGGCPVGADL